MRCYNCMKELKNGTKFCPYCGKKPDAENPAHQLPIGTELHNKYIVGSSIGEGGFGITYIGYDKTLDIRITVKEFFPSGYANRNNTVSKNVTLNKSNLSEYFNHGKESFMREAKNIATFSSEDGIVDVRDYFTENETAYIVMEYLDGENLGNYIGKHGNFSAEKIFSLLLPIMRSLDKMHREGIIHRDISPDNIMYLKTGELKLMDFGSARYFSSAEQKTMSIMLKPGYAPYEQYSANGHQGPWTDVYGICATIYKCITNVTPPDSLDRCQNDTLKKPSDLGADITEELENVLMYGLAIYHDNRCQSMTDLIEITEKALNNEPFTFIHSENTEMQKTIDRIKAADERYKTMFAASDYSPPRPTPNQWQHNNQQQLMFSQQPLPQGNWNNYPPQPPQPNNKSNTALIAVLISLAALVIAAAVIVIVFLLNNNDSGNTNQGTEAAVEATASAESGVPTSAPTTSESTTVKVADVTGKKLAEAKKALEDQGLVVNTVEEQSSTVNKGYIIKQTPDANETLKKGDSVTLCVSKGSVHAPDGYDQKVVVSAESDSSYAEMTLYEWKDGEWSKSFSCDATVGKNGGISSNNSESNTLTPKGTFRLGVVLTTKQLDTKKKMYLANADTVVCDDTSSPYYNQIGQKSAFGSYHTDPVGKKLVNNVNNALIFIEHNGDGFSSTGVSKNNSSVITICGCNSSISPTNGCIDISASNMNKLLSLLDESKNPHITTEVK